MQAELDRRVKEEEEERARGEDEAKERSVRDFELLQMGLEIRNRSAGELNPRAIFGMGPPKVVGKRNGKIILEEAVEGEDENESFEVGLQEVVGGEEGKRGTKRKFELDEEELMRLAREERQKAKNILDNEKFVASIQKLPSFWVPSLTPSVAASDIPRKALKLNPVCPASEKNKIHNYSLKGLVVVQFAEEKDERTKHGDPQRVCPSCKKGLNNATKATREFSQSQSRLIRESCFDILCSGQTLRSRPLQTLRRQVHVHKERRSSRYDTQDSEMLRLR